MKNRTFVAHVIEMLPEKGTLATHHRKPEGFQGFEPDPVYTNIRLAAGREPGGYERAEVTHRRRVKVEGKWNGNNVHELVEERKFSAYYNRKKGLFIARAQSAVAGAAVKRLNKELPRAIRLRRLSLDLDHLRASASEVAGVWYTRTKNKGHISRESACGKGVDQTREYSLMSKRGKLTGLSASIRFDRKGIEARISRTGSVSFLKSYTLLVCLGFAEYVSRFQTASAERKPAKSVKATRKRVRRAG